MSYIRPYIKNKMRTSTDDNIDPRESAEAEPGVLIQSRAIRESWENNNNPIMEQ